MSTVIEPLPRPPDYTPQTQSERSSLSELRSLSELHSLLPAQRTENGVFHESRKVAALAQQLAAKGAPQDLELAEKVLEVVLRCQELNPDDRHTGNFYWMLEDTVVFDLNAVEFNLERLIPMMIQHGERLSPDIRQRVLHAIRLGLAEIERLNVLPVYSNIALLDILNTCLGGELLNDEVIAQRGADKLVSWMQLTAANGTPYEFNSPTYTSVDMRALGMLAELTQRGEVRLLARAALARLGLSVALHIHPRIGRWSGPHGRAYQPSIACETAPEIELLKGGERRSISERRSLIADGTLPAWIRHAVDAHPETMQVDETSFRPRQMTQTTYHSASFSLGTASCELSGQSNVLISHMLRPGSDRPGVLYTRYLTNEKWLGDFYHATDRTHSRNLIDEGRFWGVQQGSRAIGLYSLPQNPGVIHSAKAALIWTERAAVDEIWVGEQRVETLPADIPAGAVVVIGCGEALTAVRVLNRTDLAHGAPLRLRTIQGDLALEIYNYLGPEKPFWELNWPGAFYQGRPQCGFYLEMAERSAYPDGRAFGQRVAEGDLHDHTEAPFVYAGDRPRRWQVSYTRQGQTLGLEIDLMAWALLRRWTQAGELGFPMLASPLARQEAAGEDGLGEIRLGGATLSWGQAGGQTSPAWLFAAPAQRCWVAGYTGLQPVPLTLETPEGKAELPAAACGTLVWEAGQVQVEALSLAGQPILTR